VRVNRPDPATAARDLVSRRFPEAEQAWLSGSVVLGGATVTSDLDITVLMDRTEVRRESLVHDGWPVELFVHTEASIRHFVAQDVARRRPTMARLVATGIPLVAGPGGEALQRECAATVAAGPGPVPADELAAARYLLTDQLDDLAGGGSPDVRDASVVEVWRSTAELLLSASGWWQGGGKWLVREVQALDRKQGSRYAPQLHAGLRSALDGDATALVLVADAVLDLVGGRLWDGYTQVARLPDTD
jgi:hypothetical protein